MYPHDLRNEIRRDVDALGRMLVVLDDDPTGTQTVHSVAVLADWEIDTLATEVGAPYARPLHPAVTTLSMRVNKLKNTEKLYPVIRRWWCGYGIVFTVLKKHFGTSPSLSHISLVVVFVP